MLVVFVQTVLPFGSLLYNGPNVFGVSRNVVKSVLPAVASYYAYKDLNGCHV